MPRAGGRVASRDPRRRSGVPPGTEEVLFGRDREPAGAAASDLAKMGLAKMTHQRRVAGKRMAFEVKTALEATRPVGVAPGA